VAKLNQTDRSVSISCMTGCRFPDGLAVKTFYCSADGSWDYDLPQCDGMHRVFVQLFRYRQRKISIISTHLVVTILLTSAGSNGCSASSICTSFIPYDVRPLLNLNGLQCRLPPPTQKKHDGVASGCHQPTQWQHSANTLLVNKSNKTNLLISSSK